MKQERLAKKGNEVGIKVNDFECQFPYSKNMEHGMSSAKNKIRCVPGLRISNTTTPYILLESIMSEHSDYRVTSYANLGKYQDIISQHAIAAAGAAGVGAVIPLADTIAVSGIWIAMIARIAERSGHQADDAIIQKFVITILQGAGSYIVGTAVLRVLMMTTGIGIIGAAVLNALLNFLYTARLGIFIAEQFDRPGFEMTHALATVDSLIQIVFSLPTIGELKFAFNVTQGK